MTSPVFIGALATHRLVGRTRELAAIRPTVAAGAPGAFQCLVFQARGGKGKTRLLRETWERLGPGSAENPERGSWASPGVVALPLIDLGDTTLHLLNGFFLEVRQSFASVLPTHEEAFARFDQAWLAFEQARDGQADHAEVSRRSQELRSAFERDYAALTSRLRVVWLLDTLEQLFAVPEEIEALLDELELESDNLEQTTYAWLLQFIERASANTTLLLAGRPSPGRWLDDVRRRLATGAPDPVELDDFTLEETRDYLQYLCDQLEANEATAPLGRNLREQTDEPAEISYLHRLTAGNPVRLALYIDLFVNADPMPEALRFTASAAAQSDEAIIARRKELDRELLDHLAKLSDPEPLVLQYLSIMRRGLDVERLSYLWGPGNGEAAVNVLNSLQRFSFIKSRSGRLFLHDEFYTIYQEDLARQAAAAQVDERERQREIFDRLLNFCQERIDKLTEEIYFVQADVGLLDKEGRAYLEGKARLRQLRAERRRVRAELLHYQLYRDPVEGLNRTYYELTSEAFLAREHDLDELLQAEVALFFFGATMELNRVQVGLDPGAWLLLRFHVLHDRVARWIKRLTALNLLAEAQQFTQLAHERHRALASQIYAEVERLHEDAVGAMLCRLFGHEWDAYRCFAAIYTGKNVGGAVEVLCGVIAAIEELLRLDRRNPERPLETGLPAFRLRLLNVLAEALIFAGFGYANLYNFRAAEQQYRRAVSILERTGFRMFQAEVSNNLGRVLGELGQLHEALALCERGLVVRNKYGYDLLRGLSLNTLALVNTRNARPTRALVYAHEALTLFRQIDHLRGIGLALIQEAEARRRIWSLTADELRGTSSRLTDVDRTLLEQTLPLLQEAASIFGEKSPSPLRLAEVWIELGCLYRDWAGFFGLPEAQDQFAEALSCFEQAMALAQQQGLQQHYLSALINVAWLHKNCQLSAEARRVAEKAYATIPADYQFGSGRVIDLEAASNVVNFRELSKLSSLVAELLVAEQADLREVLREHIFAITYLQLFSPYEPFYLGVTRRQLSTLLNKSKPGASEIDALAKEIITSYHLDEAMLRLGVPLQAEQVIKDALVPAEVLDYL